MWKDDEITGGSYLSTSYDQDFIGIESRFDGYRVYGTTVIFLWEIGADSYESAIRGFWEREIALNLIVI